MLVGISFLFKGNVMVSCLWGLVLVPTQQKLDPIPEVKNHEQHFELLPEMDALMVK
jgi:hypothetical protein